MAASGIQSALDSHTVRYSHTPTVAHRIVSLQTTARQVEGTQVVYPCTTRKGRSDLET